MRFDHVTKHYHTGATAPAVNDLCVTIDKSEFVTIVGSSGSGKTTTLKMVNGLIEPNDGTIYINGNDIKSQDIIELRRRIGYVIQGSALFPHMTVEKNILYVPSLRKDYKKEDKEEALHKWMGIVGLDYDLLERYPDELSGGQQQRVGFARALAASPALMLMDEPFGAVDAITRGQLQEEIKRIHDTTGITILFVTHDIREAMYLGTKMMVMDKGVLLQYDTPDNVISDPATDYVDDLITSARL
ncbi:MAG: ABC transporter ATP-binding protein [Coriobacteriales bacterium]|nr:ABC transporter ATP-binding protein [Coriobacteriales bacterium]